MDRSLTWYDALKAFLGAGDGASYFFFIRIFCFGVSICCNSTVMLCKSYLNFGFAALNESPWKLSAGFEGRFLGTFTGSVRMFGNDLGKLCTDEL